MIPLAQLGIIGGSTTWGARFPEDFPQTGLEVVGYLDEQDTPFGRSAPLKLLGYKDTRVLYSPMHGSYPNKNQWIHPYFASQQLAWIFKQAKVEAVIGGGSVGGIQDLAGARLPRWSVLIPDDFLMFPSIVVVHEGRVNLPEHKSPFYRMAKPFDRNISGLLYNEANTYDRTVFPCIEDKGVYVCTPLGRFETATEIRFVKMAGGNVVGQTIGHEAIALRNMEIPFGVITIVANDAEGDNWVGDTPDGMTTFYHECPLPMAIIIANAAKKLLEGQVEPESLSEYRLTGLEVFPVEGA